MNEVRSTYCSTVSSPIGVWRITANDSVVTGLEYQKDSEKDDRYEASILTKKAKRQLTKYFQGSLKKFDLPLGLSGHPPFYQQVWEELLKVPYGRTSSYSDLAIKLSNPKAVRAVGMANGKNPIAIIIPCHRILGKDRSLTGYASGLEVKKWLLEHEGAIGKCLELF